MPITAYHRPQTVEQASQLLARQHVKTAALFGLNALVSPETEEVVDLQALGLNQISVNGHSATLEALVRLQSMVDAPELPAWLREIARQEAPNTFRNMDTIASTLSAARPESVLLAALLVCDAQVAVQQSTGVRTLSVADYLTERPAGIPVRVVLQVDGKGAQARLGRTPADEPIVAAVGRRATNGTIRLALCGVAATPILATADQIQHLQPVGDFRGSPAYRLEMAQVLSVRVTNALS